jgi:serine/threonine protein kinase
MPTNSLVKVGDLGIAVLQDEAGVLTRSLRGMGTIGYISPEQQYALKVDERTDQYSLAALSYELLTGRRPLGLFPPPSRLNPQLSRGLDAVILRGLSEERKDRFLSVRDFVAALDRALHSPAWRVRKLSLAFAVSLTVLSSAAGLAWVLGVGSKGGVGIEPRPALPDSVENRPAANPVPARPTTTPTNPQAKTPERSREFTRLVELRAYMIWYRSGRPTGPAGEAVKEKNWLEAERQIRQEVEARAYQIWERQGRPTGAAGESVRETNLRSAEAELLQQTAEDLRRHPIR